MHIEIVERWMLLRHCGLVCSYRPIPSFVLVAKYRNLVVCVARESSEDPDLCPLVSKSNNKSRPIALVVLLVLCSQIAVNRHHRVSRVAHLQSPGALIVQSTYQIYFASCRIIAPSGNKLHRNNRVYTHHFDRCCRVGCCRKLR